MKRVLAILLLSLSFSISAADDCVGCENKLQGMPTNNAINEVAKLGKIGGDLGIEKLAVRLCVNMVNANATGKDIVKVMEDQILEYMKISRSTPNYKDKIITFWNDNKNGFVCHGKMNSKTRETEHLMKRAIALSIHNKVFYEFLLDTEDVEINPNAVEYVNGQPETVVDYLDKILADPNSSRKYVISDIKRLRKDLVNYYGAKSAREL